MKEISLESLPPCFEKWCLKFDDLWENKAKKTGFRCYLAGLLEESKRKNILQITDNIVGSSYHNVHHFLGKSKWNADDVNERRLQIMNKRNQTRIRNGCTLIVDDSGHVKSGSWCACVLWGFPRVVRSAILLMELGDNISVKLGKLRTELLQ